MLALHGESGLKAAYPPLRSQLPVDLAAPRRQRSRRARIHSRPRVLIFLKVPLRSCLRPSGGMAAAPQRRSRIRSLTQTHLRTPRRSPRCASQRIPLTLESCTILVAEPSERERYTRRPGGFSLGDHIELVAQAALLGEGRDCLLQRQRADTAQLTPHRHAHAGALGRQAVHGQVPEHCFERTDIGTGFRASFVTRDASRAGVPADGQWLAQLQ